MSNKLVSFKLIYLKVKMIILALYLDEELLKAMVREKVVK